jgi:hypothetical protein
MDTSGGGGGGAAGGASQIQGMATHGGRYVLYNVYGNLFEVASKYAPPIRPIGRGAYGIVWCVASPFPSPHPLPPESRISKSDLLYMSCVEYSLWSCLCRFGTHVAIGVLGIYVMRRMLHVRDYFTE